MTRRRIRIRQDILRWGFAQVKAGRPMAEVRPEMEEAERRRRRIERVLRDFLREEAS